MEVRNVEVNEAMIEFDDALAAVFVAVKRAERDGESEVARGVKRSYPTLTSVDEAIREALTTSAFSYPQLVTTTKDDGLHVRVTTQLRRKGIMIESTLAMPVGGKGSAQDIGSAITYARRYSLAAMMGVCPDEDDDGEKASQPRPQSRPPKREPERPPRSDTREPDPGVRDRADVTGAFDHNDDPVANFKRTLKASQHTWSAVCEEAELTIRGRPSDHELSNLWKALNRLNTEPPA